MLVYWLRASLKKRALISGHTANFRASAVNAFLMDVLYDTIKKDVYAFALSKVKNKFDADDILQDTFIRIYENAKLYTKMGKPLAWIFTIESNVINRFLNLKNNHEIVNDDVVMNSKGDGIYDENKEEEKEFVNKLLNRLNEFEREVISLHLVSNLKFKEISILLNKPLSTILSKYNRAIKKLKIIIKEEM